MSIDQYTYDSADVNLNETEEEEIEGPDAMRAITFSGRVFIVVAYSVLFFVGSTSNLAILAVIVFKKSLRTPTNIMIANLTLGDLLMNIPLVLTPLQAILGNWLWSEMLCRIFMTVAVMSVFISSLTLVSLALHRYLTIMYVRSRQRDKCRSITQHAVTRCLVIWVVSIVITIPTMINTKLVHFGKNTICTDVTNFYNREVYTMGLMIGQFVVPSVAMFYCHIRIHLRLKKRFTIISAFAKTMRTTQKLENIARRRQIHRVLVIMVIAYIASWLPLNAFNLTYEYSNALASWDYTMPVFFTVHYIAMASTVFNPLMYAVANPDFRRKLNCYTYSGTSV